MPRGFPIRGKPEEAAARRQQALQLRIGGATYQQIADSLGVSVGEAHKDVQRELRETAEANHEVTEEVRRMEVERLDGMLLGLWTQARSGNHAAIDRVLRIMERRAKLLGLDVPQHTEVSGPSGGPIPLSTTTVVLQLQSGEEVDAFERMRERYNEHMAQAGREELMLSPPSNGHREEEPGDDGGE